MKASALRTLLVVVGLAAVTACWTGDRLLGKACDYEHPCFDGYRCAEGRCLYDRMLPPKDGGVGADAPDGGPADGGPADGGPADGGGMS